MSTVEQEIRDAATTMYGSDDVVFSETANVERVDGGAWVSAEVWVPEEAWTPPD